MNEKLVNIKNKTVDFWSSRTKKQQFIMIGSTVLTIVLIAATSWFATRPNLVPL